MPRNALRPSFAAVSVLVLSLLGCGSPDEVSFSFVSDFSVDPGSAQVGGQATVVLKFESSTQTNSGGVTRADRTEVGVVLPRGLDYVSNTSEFNSSFPDVFDVRSPTSFELCGDGSRALLYTFAGSELSNGSDNQIRFRVKPTEQRGAVTLRAEASSHIASPCNIIGQGSDTLIIE